MFCEKCRKNVAKVYFKKTVKNKSIEYFLCHECSLEQRGGCFLTNITEYTKVEQSPSDELKSFTTCKK